MAISSRYVTGEYEQTNPTFHVEDSPWKAGQIRKMLEQEGVIPKRVAEVGCGAGEILVQLAKQFPETKFDGYELSPQGFALCKQRESPQNQFFNTEFGSSDGPSYDTVLCIDVFEHVEDYLGFLRGIRGKGNGFIFHIPLDMNVQMVFRASPILMVRTTVGHLHYFSKDTALATLRECGYEIRSWFYTPNGVERPRNWKGRFLKLPRKAFFAIHADLAVRVLGGYSLLVYAVPRQGCP